MKNNTSPRRQHAEETNIVYHFTCSDVACQRRKMDYIGLTTATLRQRMQQHTYNGAIKDHFNQCHHRKPTVNELVSNTTIIHRIHSKQRLMIAEAVSIALKRPKLNVQREFDYVLPSCRRRNAKPEEQQTEQEREQTTRTNVTNEEQTSTQTSVTEPHTDHQAPSQAIGAEHEPSGNIRDRLRPRTQRTSRFT